ncbi:MAG: hypothetical protein R2705_06650 [Ilumatobacteraceae bacterium]
MTLVEMVLAVTIMGFIMSAIAMSLLVIVRSGQADVRAPHRGQGRGVPADVPPRGLLVRGPPRRHPDVLQPISGETLPGTNVLTLYRQEGATSIITSYRYEQVGEDWQLALRVRQP